jgi:outer membrane protein assembly factor BamB
MNGEVSFIVECMEMYVLLIALVIFFLNFKKENKMIWKKELGPPINAQYFTLTQFHFDKELELGYLFVLYNDELHCLNYLNGETIWKRKWNQRLQMMMKMNQHLFLSIGGTIQCISFQKGEDIYKIELLNKESSLSMESSSLLFTLDKKFIYSSFQGSIYKMDIKNGKEIWKIKQLIQENVIITMISQEKYLLCFLKGTIFILNSENGKWIKKMELMKNPIISPMSVLKVNENVLLGYIDKIYSLDLDTLEVWSIILILS